MIRFRHRGDFKNTDRFFERVKSRAFFKGLDAYGEEGVKALSAATPVDSGKTSESWSYEIKQNKQGVKICFSNSNVNDGVLIAIILQYGHGTRNGGWVEGQDYINPAIAPVFDNIVKKAWKEVKRK